MVDVNGRDAEWRTPLMNAVLGGNPQMVHKLLQFRAVIDAQNKQGETSLILALNREFEDVMEKLLQCGADANIADHNGQTPLMIATQHQLEQSMKILIRFGANISAALYSAVELGPGLQILQQLQHCSDVNVADASGRTPLYQAVRQGNTQGVVLLIEAGADINSRDQQGKTTLLEALWCRQSGKVVAPLLEAGADVNISDNWGKTPLLVATGREREEFMKDIIQARADVNAANQRGKTPLMIASRAEFYPGMKMLLDSGADVNATDAYGYNALTCRNMEPCLNKMKSCCVILLLKAGLKINNTNAVFVNQFVPNEIEHVLGDWAKCKSIHRIRRNIQRFVRVSAEVYHVLFAAGQKMRDEIPLADDDRKSLQHLSRSAIRQHLLDLDPQSHLFLRVPQLSLPTPLHEYLLFGVSLDEP